MRGNLLREPRAEDDGSNFGEWFPIDAVFPKEKHPRWIKSVTENRAAHPLSVRSARVVRSQTMSRYAQDPLQTGPTASRGWWRLTASVLGIVGVTLAFGYYIPLRQANQLLSMEFDKARQTQTELGKRIETAASNLASVTLERDSLRDAQALRDSDAKALLTRVQHLIDGFSPVVLTAVKQGRIELVPSADALAVRVLEKTWITPASDGLTRNGHRALCPLIADASKERATVTVRTFLAQEQTSGESRWSGPSRLAAGVAETLIERCNLSAGAVTISTSTGTGASPLVQLEFNLQQSRRTP